MRMNKIKTKSMIQVVIFVFLIFLATNLGIIHKILPDNYSFVYSLDYVLSVGTFISVFSAWTISVYNRIMQSRVRTYLMLIGVNIIFWISIRSIKWGPFGKMVLGDRLAWYMYYIPMIMIPLLFFFAALCVGEDENYKPNKKWNLLFIPAVLLILLVLTNDLHFIVFSDFDLNAHMYGMDYEHRIGYYIIAIFLSSLIVLSTALIIKKFRYSATTRKASRLPLLVVGGIIVYTVLYVLKPNYGIGYYFMDVTMFSCTAAVAFWEACIRTGLVHSNNLHKEFFEMGTSNAQILNLKGEVVYTAESALPISNEKFKTLIEHNITEYDENTLLHILPIKGGYVSWSSDISKIKNAISELEKVNESLYKEINLLNLQNENKKEGTRAKKLNELQNVLLTETLPYSEKIKNTVIDNEKATLKEMKQLLFETSVISAYIKRKVNLILTDQTEKCISTDEMHRAFLEIFEILKFYERKCTINIINNFDMSLNVAILCYDLFQKVLEKSLYKFNILYITFDENKKETLFTITIESDKEINFDDLMFFEMKKLNSLKGKLKLVREFDSYYFSLTIPK